jgi:cystathionine beta-lyase
MTDFDEIIDRRNTASLKWDRYRDRSIIPMWVADMEFRSPPAVMNVLREKADYGIFGYSTVPSGLIDAVCAMLHERYDWKIDPRWLVWLPGLVSGLNVACRSVGRKNDEIISMVPIYPPFLEAPGNVGRQLVTVPMVQNSGKWEIDFSLLKQAVTREKTRMLLLCSPQNPTGRVFTQSELGEIVSLCERNNIVICSDEIHCDLVLDADRKHKPTATVSGYATDNTITLMAPSKTFNIPGLGCSFAVISNSSLRAAFLKAMAGIVPEVNSLGFAAAEAAYRDGWDWLSDLLEYLRENRRLVQDEISSMPQLNMCHVEATYLAWIDARAVDKINPGRYFEKYGVGFSEGRDFGLPGFVRLNFGCQRSVLEEALKRVRQAVTG